MFSIRRLAIVACIGRTLTVVDFMVDGWTMIFPRHHEREGVSTMTIARKLQDYIDDAGVAYDTVAHHRTSTTSQTARAAHVPGNRLAKSVVVHHEMGYVLAVVPSTHRVELSTLQDVMDRRLGLASEEEVCNLFADCDIGAVPPIGSAYDVPVLLDEPG